MTLEIFFDKDVNSVLLEFEGFEQDTLFSKFEDCLLQLFGLKVFIKTRQVGISLLADLFFLRVNRL